MTKATVTSEEIKDAISRKEGKYLTFALGSEEYGLEILKVREIIGYIEITAVPQMPEYVKGVINLRGQVIPVIDLRSKFGMETADITEQTCIIVIDISNGKRKCNTGIVVDRVQEVLDINSENIQETPEFSTSINTDFILGIGKVGTAIKILLDIEKVLTGINFNSLNNNINNDNCN
ncbi:MAG: purine-binding chemotaxis protein CheW [Sedimentisphaerales bacterium]|nr:purine-binding chemotaxis protein CheW [Sedimentisphaerales bacterium]